MLLSDFFSIRCFSITAFFEASEPRSGFTLPTRATSRLKKQWRRHNELVRRFSNGPIYTVFFLEVGRRMKSRWRLEVEVLLPALSAIAAGSSFANDRP
jgi:hypothetical protein